MKYIASCSFGKDSLATVILAKIHNEPLDAVVYARVMYDQHRSAEVPEHEEFIQNAAIPMLESWGIPVYTVQSDKTFMDCFYRVRCRGKMVGKIVGFPLPGICDVQRDCKLPAIRKAHDLFKDEEVTWYLGIAKDEPVRLKRLTGNQISLLDKYGYTEDMAVELTKQYGLYSPVYAFTKRGGCFFCPNQKDEELLHLRTYHPDLWDELRRLDQSPNRATDDSGRAKFNRKETFQELDLRLEKEGRKRMRLIVYDCEVFCEDWLVVFKDIETGQYTVIHNDTEEMKQCISEDCIYIGFNSKHYDQFIIKAICCGFTPQEVKQVNDFIIGGGQGWECPILRDQYFRFNNVDIRDDVQSGLSLKAIEGHLGMNIKETEVSFDLDRPLTEEEVRQTIHYCKHDVDATHELMKLRADYLRTKKNLGKRAGIDEVKSLSATNAKLTAMMLRAERKEWNDGRDYVYPENLDLSVIPQPILDFFDTIHDMSIPDEQLFKTSFEIEIGGMLCKYAWGGVHGSLTTYFEEAVGDRIIQNRDVSSLYPSLIEIYNYLSRNVPDPELFYAIKRDRIEAKHTGDKQTAKDLKLPLNTVSGAQENKYNDLYDPLPTRSLRISGQLFLTVLTMRLLNACKTIKLLNLNTDGLMYSIDKSELPIVDRIASEWEAETKFELETDEVQKVWIKDVNNLLMLKTDGEVKTVGGYLNYGISVKGAWAINNNMVIVKKALIEYFVNGTPVEETINGCNDIFQFQLIAKAGVKYREAYHLVDGEKVPVQKVNRVYATKDERYGKLFKVKAENDTTAKIEMLPEHCIIDNDNQLSISDVDKTFYIETAKKRVNDFKGIKPERKTRRTKKMASTSKSTTPTNVYQKLMMARAKFLESDVQKTGKNMHLSFKYFELEDIVPTAIRIFNEVGLIPIVNFTTDVATMDIVNTETPGEVIQFVAPFNQIAPIVSNAGKQATNEMQALGSSITYMRRYLYMIALDICESDSIDANAGSPAAAPTMKAPPATPEQRQEVKQELTAPADNATPLQIKGLKAVLKKLKDADPAKEEMIAQIAVQTQGFTVISKADCEALIQRITTMLEGGQE